MNVVTNNKWIGERTIRPDGADKVTGRAAYAAAVSYTHLTLPTSDLV